MSNDIANRGEILLYDITISILETVASLKSSPSSNILDKCFEIAGTLTSNNSAIAFCVIQNVSSLKTTLTHILVPST